MLALREVIRSRPVRAMKALLMRALDSGQARSKGSRPSKTESVRGLDGAVTVARDAWGVPGIFAGSRADLGFGMGWACAEDRLFQIELTRRAARGDLAATFGDRPVDPRAMTKLMAGRTFVDVDAFTRAVGFRAAAEASYTIASSDGRAWVDAYAHGVNAFIASGRRPLEMLLLDIEPAPWTGVDALLVARMAAFQLTFSYRFALAWALVAGAVDGERAGALRPMAHPLTPSRWRNGRVEPLLADAEMLRAVLGADGVHLGSNAFAVAPSRSTLGRAVVASDPHMPLLAPSMFWEVRLKGGDVDARGAGVPGFPSIVIGQNPRGAWGVTAGWGDDSQVYREDLARLRREGALRTREEVIGVRGGAPRVVEIHTTPRGPVVSHVIGAELLRREATNGAGAHGREGREGRDGRDDRNGHVGHDGRNGHDGHDGPDDAHAGEREEALSLRWAGQDATLDADATLAIMRADSFGALREACRLHGSPTLNFVWGDADGHVAWQYAGRVPRRGSRGATSKAPVSGLDIVDADDPRGAWQGVVPFDDLPFVLDPPDGVVVSANARPCAPSSGELAPALGEMFEPPFRMARIRALLDARGKVGLEDLNAIQLDARSAWALHARDALLAGLDDATLALLPRRGVDLVRLVRAWDGRAEAASTGALATYALLDAVVRHIFLEDLGDEAFERYFEIMNVGALPLLQAIGDADAVWLRGRDRATIVRDGAAMAEGRLRRRLGDDPSRWTWGTLHTVTFRHAFADLPGLRAVSSPGPFPLRGDGTTVCMGEFDLGGTFEVRVAPALRMLMAAGDPASGRAVLPGGQSGDPASKHYRDQVALYLAGGDRAASWAETDFIGKRRRLVPR